MPEPRKAQVYAIENVKTGRRYIGVTTQKFYDRKRTHLDLLKKGDHYAKDMQADFDLLGEDGFRFIKLEKCDPRDKATIELVHIVEHMKLEPGVYNTMVGKTTISRLRGATMAEREEMTRWVNRPTFTGNSRCTVLTSAASRKMYPSFDN